MIDIGDEQGKSLGKFTEPRGKPECGFSRSEVLDKFAEAVSLCCQTDWQAHQRLNRPFDVEAILDWNVRLVKAWYPDWWQEAIKDPRVANITATDVKNREKELTLKTIAERTKSGRRYRFGDWLS